MTGHTKRAHALLSASGSHRWLACPPSALLEAQFPDTTSDAAKEGTLAHELAEMKVRHYFYTQDFTKRKLTLGTNKLKKNPLWQEEMLGYTEEYLDYIKSAALGLASVPYVAIEKRVDFSAYVPDGFGTADCILISGDMLHVIDFKYGRSPDGRVSAKANPQMMLYALGAFEAYKMLYPVKRIKLAIVQPRLTDGISEWECNIKELLEFSTYVSQQAKLAAKGTGDYAPSPATCKWCRGRGQCRARAEENVKLAFETKKKPPLITNDEIGMYLSQGEDVAKWLKDLQDFALKECLAGKDVSGWKAVEGRGIRAWTDMEEAFLALTGKGIEEHILYEKKPLTLAQIEKVMGVKEFKEIVGDYVVKAPGKPTLVKETDKREAITNIVSAAEAFQEEKKNGS